jgi:hypothetical protein
MAIPVVESKHDRCRTQKVLVVRPMRVSPRSLESDGLLRRERSDDLIEAWIAA